MYPLRIYMLRQTSLIFCSLDGVFLTYTEKMVGVMIFVVRVTSTSYLSSEEETRITGISRQPVAWVFLITYKHKHNRVCPLIIIFSICFHRGDKPFDPCYKILSIQFIINRRRF